MDPSALRLVVRRHAQRPRVLHVRRQFQVSQLSASSLAMQAVLQQRRSHSNTSRRHVSSSFQVPTEIQPTMNNSSSALSCLPLSILLRSWIITLVSSTPILLTPSLKMLSILANSKSPMLDPDRNFLIRSIIKHTMYKQFCAGTNPTEVHATLDQLKAMGFKGAILGYAREVVMNEDEVEAMNNSKSTEAESAKEKEEVGAWESGTLKTIDLAEPGDFVAIKFTGAGSKALSHLMKNSAPSPTLNDAILNICERSKENGVRLIIDAEQAALQDGIDAWTVDLMQKYNKLSSLEDGKALVYGTYQAYRISTPKTVADHMELAKQGEWRLGVKLVRGAYLGSDPRELFWPTKQGTDNCYNSIAKSIMERKFGDILTPAKDSDGVFPEVDLMLAGHNSESVQKAMAFRDEQTLRGDPKCEMGYGQLMGMADHVSCALVQKSRFVIENKEAGVGGGDAPNTYKYIVWGTVGECTKYLLRRAQENRDAIERTVEGRKALSKEIARRLGLARAS